MELRISSAIDNALGTYRIVLNIVCFLTSYSRPSDFPYEFDKESFNTLSRLNRIFRLACQSSDIWCSIPQKCSKSELNLYGFKLIRRVSHSGTEGTKYFVKQLKDGKEYALIKSKFFSEGESTPYTVLRHLAALKSLSHPNVMNLIRVEIERNHMWLLMPMVSLTLQEFIAGEKEDRSMKLSKHIKLRFMEHLFCGLAHCHSRGIVHRNLKPKHLMIVIGNDDFPFSTATLKIADFSPSREVFYPLEALTSDVSTLWYRAPEQLLGNQRYSFAVDIWASGCIYAELMTHKNIFEGTSVIDQLFQIFSVIGSPSKTENPMSSTFPSFPPQLAERFAPFGHLVNVDFLSKCWEFVPSKRMTAKEATFRVNVMQGLASYPMWFPPSEASIREDILHYTLDTECLIQASASSASLKNRLFVTEKLFAIEWMLDLCLSEANGVSLRAVCLAFTIFEKIQTDLLPEILFENILHVIPDRISTEASMHSDALSRSYYDSDGSSRSSFTVSMRLEEQFDQIDTDTRCKLTFIRRDQALLAIACLHLACKYCDVNIASLDLLINLSGLVLNLNEVHCLEIDIFRKLGYNMKLACASDLIGLFLEEYKKDSSEDCRYIRIGTIFLDLFFPRRFCYSLSCRTLAAVLVVFGGSVGEAYRKFLEKSGKIISIDNEVIFNCCLDYFRFLEGLYFLEVPPEKNWAISRLLDLLHLYCDWKKRRISPDLAIYYSLDHK